MSTATEPTLNCEYCSSDTAIPDVTGRTWQQWQCPHCASWNHWASSLPSGTTFHEDGRIELPEDEAVTQPGNSDDPYARMIDLVCDLAGADANKQPETTLKDYTSRARDILTVLEASDVRARWGATQPSNSKYNVADLKGNPIPDEVVAGDKGPFTTPRDLQAWLDWAKGGTPGQTWDLCDEDGDHHSPAWYLDAFITARETYLAMRDNPPKDAEEMPEVMDSHIANLDDALVEMEMYERYVNRLFNYSGE
jgi:hypothetical protein